MIERHWPTTYLCRFRSQPVSDAVEMEVDEPDAHAQVAEMFAYNKVFSGAVGGTDDVLEGKNAVAVRRKGERRWRYFRILVNYEPTVEAEEE